MDVVAALLALVLLLPVIVTLGILVWRQLGRPVLFRQLRPGYRGHPFQLLKFRTMRDAVTADGAPLPDEARLTRFGQWLRSTSLDELPEFWNVLRGDMSLVGPRPLLMQYLPLYSRDEARRHEVRPGLTGWAQVNGRNETPWAERFQLDVWYVDHLSAALDVRILLMTVRRVLRREGITQLGHATMEPFRGHGDPGRD